MSQEFSKAIVLRSSFLRDKQKILTLFSEKFGVFSLVMKGFLSKANPSLSYSLSEPFCEAEFFFLKGSSDLKKFQSGSILNLHLPLREKLCFLKTASSMAKAILASAVPEKPSKELYLLFSSFLKQIPLFSSQETLLACFYLKFLKHEGLYHESYQLPSISLKEQQLLASITKLQSFQELKKQELPPSLFKETEAFFFQNIS